VCRLSGAAGRGALYPLRGLPGPGPGGGSALQGPGPGGGAVPAVWRAALLAGAGLVRALPEKVRGAAGGADPEEGRTRR
jgi:hypothetical protein